MKAQNCLLHLPIYLTLFMMTNSQAAVPDAGQLLQQQQQSIVPQTDLSDETPAPIDKSSTTDLRVMVREIKITGHHCFTTEQLQPLVADVIGQKLNLKQLWQVAQRITDYYRQHGYGYSRAYLPQQNLSQGIVQINVLEAHYDQIKLNNNSRTYNKLLEKILAPLKQGEQIDNNKMQHQLKIINRLNGVAINNVMAPGATVGTSQLNIDLKNTALLTGYIGADNYGNEYTRIARTLAGISANNLVGLGDVLNLELMGASQNLNSAKVGYSFTLNGQGTRVGLSYSYLDYQLAGELESIGAEGKAAQSSIFINQPILLTNTAEIFLTLQYDHKQLEDDIELTQYDKHRDINVVMLRLDGANFDHIWGGGLTQYGVSTRYGRVRFKNVIAADLDQQSAQTAGDYLIASLNLSRLQHIGNHGTQVYVGIYAQYSPDNLDSAEQYLVGGPLNVRGYEANLFSGSSGYFATAELRQTLLQRAKQQLVGKIFVDTAGLTINAKPWVGVTGSNHAQISSAGLGFNWNHSSGYQLQASVAFPFGNLPQQLTSRDNSQYWLSIQKSF